ncbi:MAG: sarcosine oxidase subunit gamma SoxG [Deltaproteobacteria bacterium]|nr:MAG: sarcosine oxidase subunit gamma SoxG [Deltaproteobacteria bacterium]
MENIQRRSPIRFDKEPVQTEYRDGWQVALSYGAGSGPLLIDLSHRPKWDLQDSDLSRFRPFGLCIPENPGQCIFEKGILINRMNRTQCAIWHLVGKNPGPLEERAYTEITDGLTLLALSGKGTLEVMERVTTLDLGAPSPTPPCLIQGPILRIPCQVVLLRRAGHEATVLFSFPRGYGQAMAEALLHSGKDLGLTPGGESELKF